MESHTFEEHICTVFTSSVTITILIFTKSECKHPLKIFFIKCCLLIEMNSVVFVNCCIIASDCHIFYVAIILTIKLLC